MKTSDQIKYHSNSIWFVLLGSSFCTLYFNTKLVDPFNTPKLIILMIIGGWVTGHLISMARSDRTIFARENMFFWWVSLSFLASLFIALITSDLFVTSLIGENQRRNGFLAYFSLIMIFIFLYFKMDLQFIARLIKIMLALGLALGFYGIIQTTGNDFVKWINPYNPLITTLGNPNFASAFFALLTCISLFSLGFKTFPKKYKLLSLVVALIAIVCIVRSQSRQGLVAAAFGLIFYICCYFYFVKKKLKLAVLSSSIGLSLVSILGMLNTGPLASILYKDSVSVRGFYWRAGVEMLKNNPIFGVGLDRYGAYFKEFRDPSYPLRYGLEVTSSNAHNTLIQFFSTGGLLLGVSYLTLLLYIFKSGLTLVKNTTGELQMVSLSLLAVWVVFQAQSFISIDNIGLSIWGWVLGGSILAIYRQARTNTNLQIQLATPTRGASRNKVTVFQPVISTLILIPMLIISIQLIRFESDLYAIRSLEGFKPSGYEQLILVHNQNLLGNFIAEPYYVYQSAISLYYIGEKEKAVDQIQQLLKTDPRNLDYLYWLAWEAEVNLNKAQVLEYRLAIALYDPWNSMNYLQLGKIYRDEGDFSKMDKMLNKIRSIASTSEIYTLALSELKKPS